MTETTEGENLWTRLRRRKVVQWGIAYAAGAWGFLQGLAYVSTLLNWPAQLQKLTGLALLIGLPIVLVLAWFHGERGHSRVNRSELAILTLLFLAGGGLFWRYQHTSETANVTTLPTTIAPAVAIAEDSSIAVLPFVNMSSDKEQEYFSDGLSEELLNLLSQVPQLRVIARTSSFSFKGKEADVATIAKTLNVANVLEGSVRKSGDTLRITAQLIRASDSSHLWSQTYDRQMTDVFEVQDEIAAAVVNELKIKLLGNVPKSRATDPKAYALYLQAREIGGQYSAAGFNEAISLYGRALALDPNYVAAWVGLADIYEAQVEEGLRLPEDGIRLAREAAQQALTLDPAQAEAHATLGAVAISAGDLSEAAQHLERAIALAPGNASIIGTAASFARRLGRMDQAIELGRYEITHDPANWDAHRQLAHAFYYAGRLSEAEAEYRTALALSPGYIGGHAMIAQGMLLNGNATAALAENLHETDENWRLAVSSMAHYALGNSAESDAALADLIEKYGRTFPVTVAWVAAHRGDAERTFYWLEKAVQYRDPLLTSVPFDRLFDTVHQDPRWLPFLREHDMAPEQLAAIKFDVTLPK